MSSPKARDDRASLRNILDDPPKPSPAPASEHDNSDATVSVAVDKDEEMADDVANPTPSKGDADGVSGANTPQYTATTTTTRRNANGSVSSVYSGNKMKHLKKEDGLPLWRRDIQYDFLKAVFEDDKKVFHKASDKTSGHTFADIYLDAMAKSSKCSKILKDKLLTDRPAGVNMAMVCLLVNVGRMNTTLNFFPEMRAQLRTYHSIPSLQAHQDANAYKQLQDAPRLKSILKGATEDVEQPDNIDDIKAAPIPRTNPVNLNFVLSQQAPKISEIHFDVPRDFFDLVMKEQLSSRSRARAFMWLMWWYLESDFTEEAALNNPYGPGRYSSTKEHSSGELPLKCPQFDYLTDEQVEEENVDTKEEKEFGEAKKAERLAIISGEVLPLFTGPKRFNVSKSKMYPQNPVFSVNTGAKGEEGSPMPETDSPSGTAGRSVFRNKSGRGKHTDYLSDSDRTESASPITRDKHLIDQIMSNDSPAPKKGRGHYSRKKAALDGGSEYSAKKSKGDGDLGSMTTVFVNANGSDATAPDKSLKRSRPPTSHQIALEQYRRGKVDAILKAGLKQKRAEMDAKRAKQNPLIRAMQRVSSLPEDYDSEEEALKLGLGRGLAARLHAIKLAGYVQGEDEVPDYGAEAAELARVFRRLKRRLEKKDARDRAEAESKKRQAGEEDGVEVEVEEREQPAKRRKVREEEADIEEEG